MTKRKIADERPGDRVQMSHPEEFPYLVIREIPGVYAIRPLPASLALTALQEIARKECVSRKKGTCLVVAKQQCYYFDEKSGGAMIADKRPPSGGKVVAEGTYRSN